MDGIGSWLHRLGTRISAGLRHFMAGRYGPDKLTSCLLWTSVILMVIGLLIPSAAVKLVLMFVYYVLWGWSIFRMLSRNTYKRYQENRRFLLLVDRFKDRDHRYFDCPKCRQSVRVPRKKGKIAITCPKCKEKFIRKT